MRKVPALFSKRLAASGWKRRAFFLLALLLPVAAQAQEAAEGEEFTVVSYNVENLFFPTDDPRHADEEFLPTGARGWGWRKFRTKLDAVGRAIMACGRELPPALVGLCEVEGDSVLRYLARRSLLRGADYRYVAASTSDERGMGTALLYQRDRFRLLRAESHPVRLPSGRLLATRHLLHACGRLETGDTLDVFVVHFPSRRDGRRQTDPLRRAAARTLREKADSICARRARPYLLVMGDFNEYPSARLFREELQALVPPAPRLPEGCRVPRKYRRALAENTDSLRPGRLYNLAAPLEHARPGTYKYQGVWGVLDHILVSGTLLAPGAPLRVEARCAEPGAFPFLLQRDGKYLGLRPYRTYYGYQYQAEGTSDHLPLILRCRRRAEE